MRHRSRSRASSHPVVPEGLQFRSRARIVRAHIRSGESEATPKSAASLDDRVVRRRAGPKACASPDIPESLAFANTLAVTVKVQIHRNLGLNGQNKKNRHGKFRALHGGDGDDGDDMAKKLTMESQKFSSLTEQQNQIHHSTNPKYQNSPTRNVDKPDPTT